MPGYNDDYSDDEEEYSDKANNLNVVKTTAEMEKSAKGFESLNILSSKVRNGQEAISDNDLRNLYKSFYGDKKVEIDSDDSMCSDIDKMDAEELRKGTEAFKTNFDRIERMQRDNALINALLEKTRAKPVEEDDDELPNDPDEPSTSEPEKKKQKVTIFEEVDILNTPCSADGKILKKKKETKTAKAEVAEGTPRTSKQSSMLNFVSTPADFEEKRKKKKEVESMKTEKVSKKKKEPTEPTKRAKREKTPEEPVKDGILQVFKKSTTRYITARHFGNIFKALHRILQDDPLKDIDRKTFIEWFNEIHEYKLNESFKQYDITGFYTEGLATNDYLREKIKEMFNNDALDEILNGKKHGFYMSPKETIAAFYDIFIDIDTKAKKDDGTTLKAVGIDLMDVTRACSRQKIRSTTYKETEFVANLLSEKPEKAEN